MQLTEDSPIIFNVDHTSANSDGYRLSEWDAESAEAKLSLGLGSRGIDDLLSTDTATASGGWRELRDVEWADDCSAPDADTQDQTTNDELW